MEKNHHQLSDERLEALVLRRLRGDLSVAEEEGLAAALAADPARAEGARALERSWRELELPPLAPRPVGAEVMARLRREAPAGLPFWAQWAAAAALLLGTFAGWGLGMGYEPAGEAGIVAEAGEAELKAEAGAAELFGEEADFAEPGFGESLGESLWLAAGAEAEDGGELQ